jgi:hypothetical protein
MNLNIDPDELRPLIQTVVSEVVAQLGTLPDSNARMAFTEAEAAAKLGLKSHQLRDARLRGEIQAVKLGGRLGYTREELAAYLVRQRT